MNGVRFALSVSHWGLSQNMLNENPNLYFPFSVEHDPNVSTGFVIGRDYYSSEVNVVVQGEDAKAVSRKHVLIRIGTDGIWRAINLSQVNEAWTNEIGTDIAWRALNHGEKAHILKKTISISRAAAMPFDPATDIIRFGLMCIRFKRLSPNLWTGAVLPTANLSRPKEGSVDESRQSLFALLRSAINQGGEGAPSVRNTFRGNGPEIEVIFRIEPVEPDPAASPDNPDPAAPLDEAEQFPAAPPHSGATEEEEQIPDEPGA